MYADNFPIRIDILYIIIEGCMDYSPGSSPGS